MQSTIPRPLAEFLAQPTNIETSPAWEFINGTARQKITPTLYHSRLQRNLVNWINHNTDRDEAIQELRCIISPISHVPDLAVIAIDRPEAGNCGSCCGIRPDLINAAGNR